MAKERKYKRVCVDCGKEEMFDRKREGRCKQCATIEANKKRTDPSKTTCPECGGKKSYQSKVCADCYEMPSGEKNHRYGKKFEHTPEMIAKRSGDNHWNWKGGTTKQRSGKQIAWSRQVRENYENRCDCCDYDREYALEAHHYIFSEGKWHDDFNVTNGVALCSNCHKEFHKRFGYGNNTKEQYSEFRREFKSESEVA